MQEKEKNQKRQHVSLIHPFLSFLLSLFYQRCWISTPAWKIKVLLLASNLAYMDKVKGNTYQHIPPTLKLLKFWKVKLKSKKEEK